MTIKVIIADDSAFLRKRFSQILSSHSSIEIIDKAKNGKEAVELVLKHLPDVLILDLIMPKMTGLEAFKRIMEKYPLPTIILSSVGPSTLDSSIQALLIGAFDYIIKPGTLTGENLADFQDILIQKVKTAHNSRFKKVYETDKNNSTKKVPLRQKRVNKIFEFGKFLQEKKSSKKPNKLEDLKEIQRISNTKSELKSAGSDSLKKAKVNHKKKKVLSSGDKKKRLKSAEKGKKDQTKTKTIRGKEKSIQSWKRLKKKGALTKENNISKDKYVKKTRFKEELSSQESETPQKRVKSSELFPKKPETYLNTEIKRKEKTISAVQLLSEYTDYPSKVNRNRRLVVMGASVGGPKTIKTILKRIPRTFPYPIIIVQHLNTNFIAPFAQSLENICSLKVKVPENNERIKSGVIYIPPNEKHVRVSTRGGHPCIKLFNGKPVNFCIPSIDVLFVSAVQVYGNKVIGILLTGMGKDGVKGLEYIDEHNGVTITESKETAILYGMPKFAIQAGVVQKVLPNYKIPEFLVKKSQRL